MNTKLFMLGLLMEKNRHPYEVQQLLKNSEMKYYIKITKGSLYYTFEQLEKKDFIEIVDIIRNEQRPERTIYGITTSGKQEFEHLLLEQMIKQEDMHRPIYEALLFAQYGDDRLILEQLRIKISQLTLYLTTLQKVYEDKYGKESMAKLYILSSVILHLKTELKVLGNLYANMKNKKIGSIGNDVLRDIENQCL
ncbi:PadR family transcriptional regulator [Bacillus thuringiensis]|uniref:PadR family transcriptional regulator n=4 Tax=Bacillus thuringiensis TaxID=1428 RepID=A0AB35PIY7_BACTU|nr:MULTISPECIES: PadR family transcriptional regulator [Bacillus]MED1158264.1 PadR family transcriptional regulator [Bacillus paranthracis]AFQ26313.1 transcriptional regulator [Bacillus thuringiensis HD-789]AJH05792.1 transcriptional regulator PadR-like family protein [Bacillus thuringiensis HD1002]AND24452.1 PadR family transcriptional regulator [Bacillus thuringiensis serovar israelensis]KAA8483699.1 PadR family transcriptional regulator [Bacillus thuringiensis]